MARATDAAADPCDSATSGPMHPAFWQVRRQGLARIDQLLQQGDVGTRRLLRAQRVVLAMPLFVPWQRVGMRCHPHLAPVAKITITASAIAAAAISVAGCIAPDWGWCTGRSELARIRQDPNEPYSSASGAALRSQCGSPRCNELGGW